MEVEFVEGRLAFLRGGQLGSTFDRWKLGGPKSRSGVRGRAQPGARPRLARQLGRPHRAQQVVREQRVGKVQQRQPRGRAGSGGAHREESKSRGHAVVERRATRRRDSDGILERFDCGDGGGH